jgi:hypothetical protein
MQQSIEDIRYDLANVGDFVYMTGQLIRIIEDKTNQAEVVQLVYSTSIEMELTLLSEVNTTLYQLHEFFF